MPAAGRHADHAGIFSARWRAGPDPRIAAISLMPRLSAGRSPTLGLGSSVGQPAVATDGFGRRRGGRTPQRRVYEITVGSDRLHRCG
jgi:hypothetical protein